MKIPLVSYTKQNILKQYPIPFRWIERSLYRTAAAIIALTEESRTIVRQKGYLGQCEVVPHGYDPALFFPGRETERRRALGLRGVVIGYMGRFVPVKGLKTFVLAAAQLIAAIPHGKVMFLMVGGGSDEMMIKAAVSRLGLHQYFIFQGPVSHQDAGLFLRCMDVLVLPSVTLPHAREQFGRVLLEAMGSGVPVLGSNSGGIPQLIRDVGGGEVCGEGSVEELTIRLKSYVCDPGHRRQLGNIGARAARERYSLDAVAPQLLRVLQECAKLSIK